MSANRRRRQGPAQTPHRYSRGRHPDEAGDLFGFGCRNRFLLQSYFSAMTRMGTVMVLRHSQQTPDAGVAMTLFD